MILTASDHEAITDFYIIFHHGSLLGSIFRP